MSGSWGRRLEGGGQGQLSGCPLICRAGLRLHSQRRFQAFLDCRACAESAKSYHSCSAAPLPWRNAFSMGRARLQSSLGAPSDLRV
nr:DUF1010 domain-containing protein [Pulveribacter suum]